ncbi:RNA-binding protein Cwf29, partial [Kickxella alabastrina]
GDVICVFSQFGEVININLVRDKDTGKFKGYGFLQYEDQRSTVLAVDNLNGAKVLDRVLRVDHVKNYRQPGAGKDEEAPAERIMNAAPEKLALEEKEENEEDEEEMMRAAGIDPEDPMAAYYLAKYKKKMRREKRGKSDKKHKKRHRPEDCGGGGDGGKRHRRASADRD